MNFRQANYLFIALSFIMAMAVYFHFIPWWSWLLLLLVYIHRLIFGAIYIGQNFFIQSVNSLADINKGRLGEKVLCLTFDDGIHPELTPRTLDILNAHDIKAIFFIIGKNITGNEEILKRIHKEGHIIGNHSDTHSFWFDMKSSAEMLNELNHMNQKVIAVIGEIGRPAFMRPPYGVTNSNLARAIRKSGMKSIGWSLRSMDTIAKTKDELLQNLKRKTKPGDIILLHDRCEITVGTLTDYIAFCKDQGYTFTTL